MKPWRLTLLDDEWHQLHHQRKKPPDMISPFAHCKAEQHPWQPLLGFESNPRPLQLSKGPTLWVGADSRRASFCIVHITDWLNRRRTTHCCVCLLMTLVWPKCTNIEPHRCPRLCIYKDWDMWNMGTYLDSTHLDVNLSLNPDVLGYNFKTNRHQLSFL